MIVCLHEDRDAELVGVKLCISSIVRHSPGLPIVLSCPNAPPELRRWVREQPNVDLIMDDGLAIANAVKPTLLLRLLEQGHEEVLWIDSDIIVSRDFRERFSQLPPETLVVAEDEYWMHQHAPSDRSAAWGLRPARTLPTIANSCVIRATPHHVPLLRAWEILLRHPAYLDARRLPPRERPHHFSGDQALLTALLCSENFCDVPIEMLRRAIDIAQCDGAPGYRPSERLRTLRHGLPAFVHSCTSRPWQRARTPRDVLRSGGSLIDRALAYETFLHLELSPYTVLARDYRDVLGDDSWWLECTSRFTRACRRLSRGDAVFQEFPLAVLASFRKRVTLRLLRRRFNRLRASSRLEFAPIPAMRD